MNANLLQLIPESIRTLLYAAIAVAGVVLGTIAATGYTAPWVEAATAAVLYLSGVFGVTAVANTASKPGTKGQPTIEVLASPVEVEPVDHDHDDEDPRPDDELVDTGLQAADFGAIDEPGEHKRED